MSWRLATWVLAGIMAAAVSASELAIPVQVTDSLVPLLQAQETPGVLAAIGASSGNEGYLRPLRIGQIQVLYELADGRHYYVVFKTFHVVLILFAFACFVGALRVETATDFFASAFALAVFTGLHTFLGTVWEAYPINHFLEVAALTLFAFVLASSRGGWWADLLAVAAFALASFTLESGLLVWVVLVAARMVGCRGVSRAGLAAVTVVLGVYLYMRFASLSTGLPALGERASGFWTDRLDAGELARRFGQHPYVFYAYNVVSQVLSVLFAEPRGGVWQAVAQWQRGRVPEATLINLASSALTTAGIAFVAVRRWRDWLAGRVEHHDRLLLVMVAVLLANAGISYGYAKDEIMSPAGMFYALAAFVVVREALHVGEAWRVAARRTLAVLLLIAAGGWAVRAVGLHYHMYRIAYNVQTEWAHVDEWLERQGTVPKTDAARELVRVLRDDALRKPTMPPSALPGWAERVFQ